MKAWRTTELATLRAHAGGDALRIAARLGRTPRAVQDKARSVGAPAPRMPHAKYWPDSTRRRARALRAAGKSVASISNALGVPFGTVRRWVYESRESAAA
ncbi:hypothetical protein PQS31_01800 [Luteimonas sp BLCC-B24]|uniref:hypothetical protein n=1 Tax=Luteimonas sp. BLCC-B24 TaxID=3025317 RepID=UPI00234D7223|nr:hypothetical protein [Luteimonas sp. BLCC-B24]MDC7805565.1 hypothetical protein [Luteimonas sp. BLCC-B24]